MKDVSILTVNDILVIPVDQPEILFTGDEDEAKKEFRKLSSLWHPDRNPTADVRVLAHINILYDKAVEKLSLGVWTIPGQVMFNTIDGKCFKFKYRSHREIDVGDMYVGDNFVIYSLFKDNEDLYKNGQKRIKSFKFANDKMKDEIKRFLPEIHSELVTADRFVMVIKKTPDLLLLRDVITHFGGKLDPKHVAWVVSRIYNLTCYLKYAGIVHSGISLDSYFISPEFHSGALLGDWWYATEAGKKLTALPGVTASFCPNDVLKAKLADSKIDLEMTRAVGRELLGDIIGSKLLMDKDIPKALIMWLRSPSKGNAFDEYEKWQSKVLIDSFGKRKFVELKLVANDIYKK